VFVAKEVFTDCEVTIGRHSLSIDLIMILMEDFSVILGMDWLAAYHALIDCFGRKIVFSIPPLPPFDFHD
jgi:hypothetical protein